MDAQTIGILIAVALWLGVLILALGVGRAASRGDEMNATGPKSDDKPLAKVLKFRRKNTEDK